MLSSLIAGHAAVLQLHDECVDTLLDMYARRVSVTATIQSHIGQLAYRLRRHQRIDAESHNQWTEAVSTPIDIKTNVLTSVEQATLERAGRGTEQYV